MARISIVRRSLVVGALACLLPDRSRAQQRLTNAPPLFAGQKILIVYLSRTHNTKAVAELIHQRVGGTSVALELEKPYPADYEATVEQVARENETGYLPLLNTKIDRSEQYDIVFLGFPTWGMQLPPPVKSFLREHNFKGKTLIPFNTNAGYGVGSSFQTVKNESLESAVLVGFSVRGGVERDGEGLVITGARASEVQEELESWLGRTTTAVSRSRKEPP